MNVQEYVPTPSLPRPSVDFSDWNDPVLGMPVMAILAVLLALAVILAIAIASSRSGGRPPAETTP